MTSVTFRACASEIHTPASRNTEMTAFFSVIAARGQQGVDLAAVQVGHLDGRWRAVHRHRAAQVWKVLLVGQVAVQRPDRPPDGGLGALPGRAAVVSPQRLEVAAQLGFGQLAEASFPGE
jgi:hypothetical protein